MSFYDNMEGALEGMITIIYKNGDFVCFDIELLELAEVEP